MCACILSHLSHVQLFATLWTIVHQVPLSMGFSKWEYWSGLPCPPPGDPPNPGDPTHDSCISCTGGRVLYCQCNRMLILESETVFKSLKRTKLFITELAGESTLADLAAAMILSELLKKIIQVKHYLQEILTVISLFWSILFSKLKVWMCVCVCVRLCL